MTYNFGTSYTTKNWNANSTDLANERIILFGTPEDTSNALIPEFGCGPNGINTFSLYINTTSVAFEESSYNRITPWRKAYRFLNRFDVSSLNMDRRVSGKADAHATYKASRSFIRSSENFEVPFDHKSPVRFPLTPTSNRTGSRPIIELVYSITPTIISDPSGGWNGSLDGSLGADWSIGSTGLRLSESRTPEAIEFTCLKVGTAPNQKVDTSTSIIPAYSGEVLQFQDGEGFGYVGIENGVTKIYIDITQTDEILRWDSEENPDFNPHEWWLKTFSSIQVKNNTRTNTTDIGFKKSTAEVVSRGKNNYVISFTSNTPLELNSWRNSDTIGVEFKRKKTIVFGDNTDPWSGAKYENIQYRRFEDEFRDDVFFQVPIEPPIQTGACCIDGVCEQKFEVECGQLGGQFFGVGSTDCTDCGDDGGNESSEIQPFTLTLNGTLEDGTITINYPSGVNATGITFEVFIER